MHDDDVRAILADPRVFVASDASAIDPSSPAGALPVHPRDYGTFPRALAMARDERLLPLEAVVAKMTSLPADRFGLRDRGRIAEGAFADLVLLDPTSVRDTATFASPHAFPEGSSGLGERHRWEAVTSDRPTPRTATCLTPGALERRARSDRSAARDVRPSMDATIRRGLDAPDRPGTGVVARRRLSLMLSAGTASRARPTSRR